MRRKGPDNLETIDAEAPDRPPPPRRPPTPPPLARAGPATPSRPRRLPPPPETDVAFRRWLFAPFEACLARLELWAAAGPASPPPGRSQVLLEGLHTGEPDRRRLPVLLHQGRRRPPLLMELTLDRSAVPFGTQLTLRPVGEVRAGRRYFREGHAVLNCVEDLLESAGGR